MWRQPLRVAAIVLLAATALATSGIQSAAALALRTTLDESWRGAYDIVVTGGDGLEPIDGLLPPNTLARRGAGITLEQLDTVRDIEGVEIAAPIGEVLVPGLKFGVASLAVPLGFIEGASEQPQAFRITTTYTTDDGLGERIVERRQFPLIVDETTWEQDPAQYEACMAGVARSEGRNGWYTIDPALYPALKEEQCTAWIANRTPSIGMPSGGGWSSASPAHGEDFLVMSLPSAPQTITRITLVDPEAERALLGSAGEFLDPLVSAEASAETDAVAMAAWAEGRRDEFADQFATQLAALAGSPEESYSPAALADLRQLFWDHGDDFDEMIAEMTAETRFVPLLISDAAVADLSLKIDFEAFGAATVASTESGRSYRFPESLTEGAVGEHLGSAAADVSSLLNPFIATSPAVVWPGADLSIADDASRTTQLMLTATGRLVGAGYRDSGDTVVLEPFGASSPILSNEPAEAALKLAMKPEQLGAESAYTRPSQQWVWRSEPPRNAVPVGSFDVEALAIDEHAVDYVPLGAYAPVSTTLADGDNAGATLRPSVAGLGLVSTGTAAIGSIASAALWSEEEPVSAIRVRVAGIDGYTREAQQKVIEVATAIEDLGLEASIVAGSSPTDAEVRIDGYAFGTTDPAGAQTVGELGTVSQRWSELGAAARVELSVSTATFAILGVALAAGILLLGAVQLAAIPGRREQAAVMREVGFTRMRIARWYAAEELPGLILVALIAAAAWGISAGGGTASLTGLIAVGAVFVAATVSAAAGSHARRLRMPRDGRSRRLGASSVGSFGARQALVHPLTTSVHVAAIVIVGLASAGLTAAIVSGRAGAGASSIAVLTLAQQLGPQLALGLAGAIGGILLARLTRRFDLARRADQWAALRAAGWTSGQLSKAQRMEGLMIVVPALSLTGGLAWGGALLLELTPTWLYPAVAVGAGLATALVAFSTRMKGTT